MTSSKRVFTIKRLSPSNKRLIYYIVPIIIALFGYQYIVKTMSNQSPVSIILESNITLNLILLVFGWGVVSDNIAKDKKWARSKSWFVFLIGLFLIMVMLRLSGSKTIFG